MDEVLVSVRMITYNQEQYIAKAIESILNQKVDFRYELVIGDDASTDGTAAIVDLYQSKYPDIIKVFHRKTNIGIRENNRLVMQECYGKYIAVLEGDDFWDYDLKLKTQVEYLESHKNVIGTAHNVYCIDKWGHRLVKRYVDFPIQKRHIYNKYHAMRFEQIGHTSSYVYRNFRYILSEKQWDEFLRCDLNWEVNVSLTLGMLGKVVYFDNIWGYRRRLFGGDSWTASTFRHNMNMCHFHNYVEAQRYLKIVFGVDIDISKILFEIFHSANMLAFKSPVKENIVVAFDVNMAYAKYLLKTVKEFWSSICADKIHD